MRTMSVFANFPDRSDDMMRIPFCLDWSLHSGYLTVGNHAGRALLYRYTSWFLSMYSDVNLYTMFFCVLSPLLTGVGEVLLSQIQ